VIDWPLRLLGIRGEVASHIQQAQLRWAHGELLVIGLVLLVPAAWFIVRRHRRNLPHISARASGALSACRIGVLAVLVFVLGAPYLHYDETIDHKPVVALIVDESASMALPAGPFDAAQTAALIKIAGLASAKGETGGQSSGERDAARRKPLNLMTRGELLAAVLREARPSLLAPLQEKFDLRIYGVARKVRPIAADHAWNNPTEPEPLSDADANETALGQAIRQAVDDALGHKIAGVVLFTDGQSTAGPDPLSLVRGLLDVSPEKSPAPIVAVPVGSDQPPPDVAVVDILGPTQVAKDDTIALVVTLASQGFNGRTAHVELRDGDGPPLQTLDVPLTGARRQQVQFSYHAKQAGTHLLRVTSRPLAEETVGSNNSATLSVRVGRDQSRLLYLEGIPRWDFRFLDHALRRDKGLTTTFVMESQLLADGVSPDNLPKAAGLPSDAAKWAEYHVVMLGDVSPALLPIEQQRLLVQAVEEEGLGLIIQCGSQHMPWDYLDAPLAQLLPLKYDRPQPRAAAAGLLAPVGGEQAPAFAPFRMAVTGSGAMNPAFTLYGNASKDRQAWSQMPEFFWAAVGSQLKPGATRLADVELPGGKEKRPVVAEQMVGAGRVLIVGCDETFRWRRNVGDQLFYRFWGQALRYVARRQGSGGHESWLEAQPYSVEPGAPVAVDLYAVDSAGKPLTQDSATVTARIETGGEAGGRVVDTAGGLAARKEIRLDRIGDAGHFRGTWTTDQAGLYSIDYQPSGQPSVSASVQVASSGRELAQPGVDRETLGALADVSGGVLLELPQLGELLNHLAGETTHEQRPYEDDLWDNWFTLLLLTALYCTDVGIRRMLGLM
jgi:hypothetical protein